MVPALVFTWTIFQECFLHYYFTWTIFQAWFLH